MEHLELNRPSGVFHVVNESNSVLPFEVTCDASLCAVTPSSGKVTPRGCTELVVTNKATKPFTTYITLHSNGEKRSLRLIYSPPVALPQTLPDQCIKFPEVPAGTTSSAMLEFPNTSSDLLRWELVSVAPTYRKDEAGTMSRAEYMVFGVSAMTGVTLPGARERIPLTFHPQDQGQFTQCWTITFKSKQPVNNLARKVILEGVATARNVSLSDKRHSSIAGISRSISSASRPKDRVFVKTTKLDFECAVKETQSLSFKVGNPLKTGSKIVLSALPEPFYLKYKEVLVQPGHSARIPVKFRPTEPGVYKCSLTVGTKGGEITIEVGGKAGV
eukprot:sb/3466657/